jgi:hypothetical protein
MGEEWTLLNKIDFAMWTGGLVRGCIAKIALSNDGVDVDASAVKTLLSLP